MSEENKEEPKPPFKGLVKANLTPEQIVEMNAHQRSLMRFEDAEGNEKTETGLWQFTSQEKRSYSIWKNSPGWEHLKNGVWVPMEHDKIIDHYEGITFRNLVQGLITKQPDLKRLLGDTGPLGVN